MKRLILMTMLSTAAVFAAQTGATGSAQPPASTSQTPAKSTAAKHRKAKKPAVKSTSTGSQANAKKSVAPAAK